MCIVYCTLYTIIIQDGYIDTVLSYKIACVLLGSSPYVADVSSLSSGVHTITFNAIVNGEVRGSATQSFLVAEGMYNHNGAIKMAMYVICNVYIRCACGI